MSSLPNILLITFDCLRPDRLSGAGYRGVHTPIFDRLMNEGVTFTNAYCQAPNTWMSHACLFTGYNPYRNGVRTPLGKIDGGLETMAEIFQKAGYAVFGLPAMSLLSKEAGFARGFTEYRLDGLRSNAGRLGQQYYRTCDETLGIAKAWLRRASKPFFIWIHYFGIHSIPEEQFDLPVHYRQSYSEYAQFYDGKVVYADEQFLAPLVDYIETLGVLDETILVLWSDHGESLRTVEHKGGFENSGHNWGLTEDVMRTLLVIRAPWLLPQGHKKMDVCQSIDVFPTLLEMTGLAPLPSQCHGRSLVSSAGQPDPPAVYMENLCQGFVGLRYGRYKLVLEEPDPVPDAVPRGPIASRVRLLRNTARSLLPSRWRRRHRNEHPPWKAQGEPNEIFERLIDSGSCELFDLVTDPGEKSNIAISNSQLVLECKGVLRAMATQSISYQSAYATPEEEATIEEHLRALGYL
jgi:arylsulfatase A-like enzyme